MKTWIVRTAFLLLSVGAAFCQQPAGGLSFEVASIKPAEPQRMGMIRVGMSVDGGMLRYTNVSLKDVIRAAYKVKDFQIEGPDWLNSERFDITAKFPTGATEDNVPEMLQALLAERFKFISHKDTKDHPIYALVVGKGGAKLKPAEVQPADGKPGDAKSADAPAPADAKPAVGAVSGRAMTSDTDVRRGPGGAGGNRGAMMMMMDPSGMHLKAPAASLANIADALSRFSERPIVDMTDIKGQYDFDLVFAPETMHGLPRGGPGGPMPSAAGEHANPGDAPAEQGASIFDAVQRYGLKLEPRKAPLEVLTIDHIEKAPTEN